MTALRILRAGPGTTLQDGGRRGWLRYGVTPAGAMDWVGQATANLLAGNATDAAVIECGPGGIDVAAERGMLRVGLCASGFQVMLDGLARPGRMVLTLHPGQRLAIRAGASHVWAYLAVAGGFDVPAVLGSLSTHLRSGIGPLGGGMLRGGMEIAARVGAEAPMLVLPAPELQPAVLRFVPGPQADAVIPLSMHEFCSTPYVLSRHSDRMGYRLSGRRLVHAKGHDIVSDGVALGAIQVPGDGQPIVLMADRQPTGGYPKIGTVIRADLPLLAQTRPGETVRFRSVEVVEAVAALQRVVAMLESLPSRASPRATGPDLARLASGDLASGFVDARDPRLREA